ncbi:HNH endonuclease [uncultured virus]|nr:HNH endonuclease [uncultured virus]
MEKEKWKNINLIGFENLYLISNDGKVKKNTGKIIKPHVSNGYYRVHLHNSNKNKHFLVHRLVALTFVENDHQKINILVNHKDGNKFNNNYINLEWVTHKQNSIHAVKTSLINLDGYKVEQYDKNNLLIAQYRSIRYAEKITGIHESAIRMVCKGKRKSAGGFFWKSEQSIIRKKQPKKIIDDNFKQVKDFPNYYVNKEGEIISKRYLSFIKPYKNESGYYVVSFKKNKKNIKKYLHRIVAETFIDNPQNKEQVNHRDGNPSNNHVDNLEWVTCSENIQHSFNVLRKNRKVSNTK